MISRRAAIGGLSSFPAMAIADSGFAQARTSDDNENLALIEAFYEASNANNWAFVLDLIHPTSNGRTNDPYWMQWSATHSDDYIAELSNYGARGHIPGREGLYDYFRSRQYQNGWRWVLPNGRNSIWRIEPLQYCAYCKWEGTGGRDFGSGLFSQAPTFVHIFQIRTSSGFGAVAARQIDWINEANLGPHSDGC